MENQEVSNDIFEGLFVNRPEKLGSMIISILCCVMITPLSVGIILFGIKGPNSSHTIVNKFISMIVASGIEYLLLGFSLDILRYSYGPLHESLCLFGVAIKNITLLQMVLFLIFNASFRYAYIFILKAPHAFNDDFWFKFLSLWIISFSILSQFVHLLIPGKQPFNVYICSGEVPISEANLPQKFNYVLNGFEILCILFHLVVQAKILIYKSKTLTTGSSFLKHTGDDSMIDFWTIFVDILQIAICLPLLHKVNSVTIHEANNYPGYLYIYFLHMFAPTFSALLTTGVYYLRHKPLRKWVYRFYADLFR